MSRFSPYRETFDGSTNSIHRTSLNMRTLTKEEQRLLNNRKAGFDAFFEGTMEDLGLFAEDLGFPDPHMIIANPDAYLDSMSRHMRDQTIDPEDWESLLMLTGYFVGEILNQRLDGCWFVDEWPDTPYFLRYVVGGFNGGSNEGTTMVDPFEIASQYLEMPPGRRLDFLVSEVERECKKKMGLSS